MEIEIQLLIIIVPYQFLYKLIKVYYFLVKTFRHLKTKTNIFSYILKNSRDKIIVLPKDFKSIFFLTTVFFWPSQFTAIVSFCFKIYWILMKSTNQCQMNHLFFLLFCLQAQYCRIKSCLTPNWDSFIFFRFSIFNTVRIQNTHKQNLKLEKSEYLS